MNTIYKIGMYVGLGVLYSAMILGCPKPKEKGGEGDVEKLCKELSAQTQRIGKETEDMTKENNELADKIKNSDYGLGDSKKEKKKPKSFGPTEGRLLEER